MAEGLSVPRHIAVIMDGNGRWAKARGLPRSAGHQAGTENLRRVIRAAANLGVEYITFYAFSTENWKRPKAEVDLLLQLLASYIDNETQALHAEGARLLHIGRPEGLGAELAAKVRAAIELTKNNTRITVILAFNYGGRDEIVQAVRKLIEAGIPAEEVTEERLSQEMYTAGIPDPDLVVRTSGEKRTSNFLTWQSVYSELAFPDVYWPDFDEAWVQRMVDEFAQRNRRYGGLEED